MVEQQVAPYGAWRSPITAEMLAEESTGLGEVMLDHDAIYWIEFTRYTGDAGCRRAVV